MATKQNRDLAHPSAQEPRGWKFFFDRGFVGEIRFPPHSAKVLNDVYQQRVDCAVKFPKISDFDRRQVLIFLREDCRIVASCRAEVDRIHRVELHSIYRSILNDFNVDSIFYCSKMGISKSVAGHGVIKYLFYMLEFVGRSEGKSVVAANCLYRIRRFYESKGFIIKDIWKFTHPVLNNDSVVMIKYQDDVLFRNIGENAWLEELEA